MIGRHPLKAIGVVLGPAAVLYILLSHGVIGMSPDSLFYWSAAQTILREQRIATLVSDRDVSVRIGTASESIVRPDIRSDSGVPLYSFTTWPPGYPATIAGVMWLTGATATVAAQLVVLFGSAVTLVLAALLAIRVAGPRRGVVAAALLGVVPFFQSTGRVALSEPLFGAFALLCLLFLSRWVDRPRGEPLSFVAAGLAAVLATYTRYVGFSLYVLITLAGLFVLSQRPAGGKRVALSVVAGLLVYPFCVAPLAIRNLALTGHVGGLPRPPSLQGVWATFLDTAAGFLDGFFPVARSMIAGPSSYRPSPYRSRCGSLPHALS